MVFSFSVKVASNRYASKVHLRAFSVSLFHSRLAVYQQDTYL